MSDEGTTSREAAPVDPVAAARARIAADEAAGTDTVAGLKKQVKALWAVTIVTLVLVLVTAGFTLVPRLFGVRSFGGPNFQGQPGQFQQGGPGAGQRGTGQGTTP